jgi:hypothetical protein
VITEYKQYIHSLATVQSKEERDESMGHLLLGQIITLQVTLEAFPHYLPERSCLMSGS